MSASGPEKLAHTSIFCEMGKSWYFLLAISLLAALTNRAVGLPPGQETSIAGGYERLPFRSLFLCMITDSESGKERSHISHWISVGNLPNWGKDWVSTIGGVLLCTEAA